jgi:hypothetical protein
MKNISPWRHRGTEKNRKELGVLCVSVPLWFKLVPGFAPHPNPPPKALKDSDFLRAEARERSYAGEGANVKPKPIDAT